MYNSDFCPFSPCREPLCHSMGVQLQPGAGMLRCLGMAHKCNLQDRKQFSRAATEQAMGREAVELLSLYLQGLLCSECIDPNRGMVEPLRIASFFGLYNKG